MLHHADKSPLKKTEEFTLVLDFATPVHEVLRSPVGNQHQHPGPEETKKPEPWVLRCMESGFEVLHAAARLWSVFFAVGSSWAIHGSRAILISSEMHKHTSQGFQAL